MSAARKAEVDLDLHAKQAVALNSLATEILYGGAAGGGKSHLMRAAAIIWCSMIPGLQVYLFRRVYHDLIKNHMEGPKGFRSLLAPWVNAGFVKIVDDEIRFWNGSKIYLCHCQHEKDRFKYQGAEIHVLLIDELTHFTEVIYRFLRSRVRMVGITLPKQYQGLFPRILCGANPGNIGHLWVKTTFVTAGEPLSIHKCPANDGGMLRQYIPARLEDNPSMASDDPLYESRLEGMGSAQLVHAMRHGDWDVIEGAFFEEWENRRHVIKPFGIPEHWTRFRSFDWGSAKPFSVGWWAVVSDDHRHEGLILPRGALVRYKEWYGKKDIDVGLKLTAEQVGEGIAERSLNDFSPAYGVADPSAFAQSGGPSIMERLWTAERDYLNRHNRKYKKSLDATPWRKADNKRVRNGGHMGGWDLVRHRLKGHKSDDRPDGPAMIFFFSTCLDSIRTIPVLQHDEAKPEDLNTHMEDHAGDDVRYACASRPWVTEAPKPETALTFIPPTFNEILEANRKARLANEY